MPDNRLQLINSPTDSFVKYFLDTKPYHTKILEVIESYTFSEEMVVRMEENLEHYIDIENDALCKTTGFGVDYDDECGYDAIDCCNLFDCFGGYGFVFDNSDELLNLKVQSLQNEDVDAGESAYVEVAGNWLVDTRIPIEYVTGDNEIAVPGDQQDLFDTHSTFILTNVQFFDIQSNTENTVSIVGNHADFFSDRNEFFVLGYDIPNQRHYYYDTTYNSSTNRTELSLSAPTIAGQLDGKQLQIRNSAPNVGIYQTLSNSYDSGNNITTIDLATGSAQGMPQGSNQLGSIQLRTGLRWPRNIEIQDTGTSEQIEYKILYSEYDPDNDVTRVYVGGTLEEFSSASGVWLKTYGYFFESGYDGGPECTAPKYSNAHAGMYENISIDVEDFISPTPTPSVSSTPTPTPSVTATPTPTPTPSPQPQSGEFLFGAGGSDLSRISDPINGTWSSSPRPAFGSNSSPVALVLDDSNNLLWVTNEGSTAISTDGGQTWGSISTSLTDDAGFSGSATSHAIFADGLFVAVGGTGGSTNEPRIAYSSDGVNWQGATLPQIETGRLNRIAYGNGTFVAVSGGPNFNFEFDFGYKSSDGINWTKFSLPKEATWLIEFFNSQFVVVGSSYFAPNTGSEELYAVTSADANTWTLNDLTSTINGITVVRGSEISNDAMVVVGSYYGDPPTLIRTTDGTTWTESSPPPFQYQSYWSTVEYGNGVFFMVGSGYSYTAYSSDEGATWNEGVPASGYWYSSVFLE